MFASRSIYIRVQRCMHAVRAFSTKHGDDIVGIDFGTTNSRLAIMESQVPTLLETGSVRAIPSFVAIDTTKKVLVGQIAKCHAIAYPADGLYNIKSMLGRNFQDSKVQELKTKAPFKIIEGPFGEAWIEASNEHISPTRVCAFIIEKMKHLAESYRMRSISKAVIAVPIYFGDDQKKEIELAGKIAGLDVLGIIDEPIAAALSSKNIDVGTLAIFSLGGGTFNISILDISDGVIQVKAKEFDTSLRGEDFDTVLLDYLVEEIRNVYSVDISGDRIAMMRLKDAAEKAKLELSSSYQTSVDVPDLTGSELGPVHVKITLTRSKFEELMGRLFERIEELCKKCFEAAHVEQSIDEVILVGGMTNVPRVQQMVHEVFVKPPCMQQAGPEEAVAIGALLQCALIVEDRRKVSPDLLPLSLGIENSWGGFVRMIERESRIPCKGSRSISTSCDNEDSVHIRILQGEHMMASENKLLRQLTVTGIPRAPRGAVSVELEFCVDRIGVLTVLVKGKDIDSEWSTEVNYMDQISESFVRRMAKKAILIGRKDIEKFAVMQLRTVAGFRFYRIQKMLNFWRKDVPEESLEYWERRLADYKKAMEQHDNVDSLKSTPCQVAWLEYELTRCDPDHLYRSLRDDSSEDEF